LEKIMIKKTVSRVKNYWWVILLFVIFTWLIYIFWNCELWPNKNCTGFAGKTIWDVLELLIIPATLAGVAAFLDKLERKTDREISLDNQNEVALQNYFDAMTLLLLDHNLIGSNPNEETRTIAQVKTISTLNRLNTDRKTKLVNFLCELGLVKGANETIPIIKLRNVNLMDVYLGGADLRGADLQGTNFKGANLQEAYLQKANLTITNLENVSLYHAHLGEADLSQTNLNFANLAGSDLFGANLAGANLEGANLGYADLEKANLYRANLQGADLDETNLKDAIMPDGKKYIPEIHTKEFLTIK